MNGAAPARPATRPAPDDARGLLEWGTASDPLGDRAHALLASLMLFTAPLGTTPFAIMFGVALGYSLLRLWATGPAVGYLLFRVPLVWVLMAMIAWTGLSVLWSVDRSQAWDEFAILRFQVPALILFWPVIDRCRSLVLALAAGAALAAVIQVGQFALGESWPLALWWHGERIAGRYPGLLHPNLTAVLALAALFMLPRLAIEPPSRWRLVFPLWPAALLSLILTGSRGCWIAALAGTIVAIPQIGLCARAIARSRAAGRRMGPPRDAYSMRLRRVLGLALAIVVIGLGLLLAPLVTARLRDGISQMRAATEQGDYSGDVAARWRQVKISMALCRERPLTGVGAGGYHFAAREYVARFAEPESTAPQGTLPAARGTTGLLTHPHSALLYYAAVLGVPGLALILGFWILLFVSDRTGSRRQGTRLTHAPAFAALFTAFALDAHNLSAPGTIAVMLLASIILYRRCAGEPSGADGAASEPCA